MPNPPNRDDKRHLGSVWRASIHVDAGHILFLDRKRFEAADPRTPWALFQGPMPSLAWLVRGDGLVAATCDGVFYTGDNDVVRMFDHPNPIGLLLAACTGTGQAPSPEGSFHWEAWRGQNGPTWMCMAANAAARALPPVHTTPENASTVLEGFHQAWMGSMHDPFPDLRDHTTWTEAEALELQGLACDVLYAVGFTEGVYAVGSWKEGKGHLHIYDPNAWESDQRISDASAVLRHLVDPKAFQGWTWEYNDGPRDRASGYDEQSATICHVDVRRTSAHGQMAGKRRTLDRLAATPDQGRAVLHLLDTTS